jgi:hypothetical protein
MRYVPLSNLLSVAPTSIKVIHHRRLIQSIWDSDTSQKLTLSDKESSFGKIEPSRKDTKKSKKQKISNLLSSSKETARSIGPSSGNSSRRPHSDNGRLLKSVTNGEFSIDQELDMELSEGEIIYLGSESEEELESKYSIQRTEPKQPIYISDDEKSIDHHPEDGESSTKSRKSPVKAMAVTPNRTRNGTIKLDRKREYWSSKANTVIDYP